MKTKVYSFLFLLIMLSCNNRTQKNDDVSMEVLVDRSYNIQRREPLADSTWYNHITEAWEKRDTAAFRFFFESWYQHMLKTDCTPDVPYRAVMDTIIKVIYDENLTYYVAPPPLPKDSPPDSILGPKEILYRHNEYAVFYSQIYYSVIDTTLISFEEESLRAVRSDTMYFRPNEKFFGRKIIMWTDPYRRYLDAFIDYFGVDGASFQELSDKRDFVEHFMKGGFNYYIEDPIVSTIILNKELDAAYVVYLYLEQGNAVWLEKRDGKWIIVKTKMLFIS